MKTSRTWLAALLAALAVVAAACGGDDASDAVDEAVNDGEAALSEAEDAVEEALSEAEDAVDAAQSEAEDAADAVESEVEGATDGGAVDVEALGLANPPTITVGSDIAFEPFEFIQDNEPVGFDIDLMNEITSRLGLEPEYENVPFDTIFTQLAGGAFDAIISAITITEERDQTIDFTDPYFAANQALAVLEDSEITGVADLTDGVVVGVQAATTGADYALENFSDAQITEFPTSVDAFNALAAGQIDAVFIDLPVVGEQVDQGNAVLAEEVDTGELYGIGVQEGNTALAEAINGVLAEIIADGTYAEIYGTWFEGDVPEQFAS